MIVNFIGLIVGIIIFLAGIELYRKSPRVRQTVNLIYDEITEKIRHFR